MKTTFTQSISSFILFLSVVCTAQAQSTSTIAGKVSTSDGQPAYAVTISLKELNKITTSTTDGSFVLKNVKPGTYTVKSSFVGLESQEKTVTVESGQTIKLDFQLVENAEKLNEVVVRGYVSTNQKPVTIGKANIKPLDNPQMVQVVSSAVIADQQANRLSDVIKNVNGVALGAARGSTQETFYARGYNLSSTNVFKNGARVSSGAIPEASTLESVEVLKGSAAMLYGNVTSGAVINMVTKQPKYNFGGEVSMRTGSYDFYKPTLDLYGPISNKLAFRVIGTGEKAKSFRSNVTSDRLYINPSLLYKFTEKTTLLVQGDYLDYDNTPDFGIGSLGNNQLPTSLPRSSFFNTPWAYNKAKQTSASANFNHEINSNWKVNSLLSFQNYKRNYFSTERIQADPDGDWGRKLSRSKNSEDFYNAQLNILGSARTGAIKHELLIGSDAESYVNLQNAFDISTSAVYDSLNILNPTKFQTRSDEPANNIISYTKTPTYRFGVFAQDLISVTHNFKVLAGLRWSYQKIARGITYDPKTDQRTGYAAQYNAVTKQDNGYDRAFSPKLGVVYQPLKTMALFANYSNNFVLNTGATVDSVALDPSLIDQFEVGIKNDFLQGKLSVNFSVYRIVNNKFYVQAQTLQDGATSNANSSIKELAGETTSDGAELDINGTIIPGLTFVAGYSYNFIRYTETSGKKFSYVTGERLVGSTANTANATLFYTLNAGRIKGLKLGASAFYTGERNGGWNNQNGGLYNYDRLIPLSAFTTFDLSAGYTFKRLSLLTKVSNITNELNYYVHENYSVNPIAPRQFVTTLSYKF